MEQLATNLVEMVKIFQFPRSQGIECEILCTTLQSLMNAKLGQQRSWPCNGKLQVFQVRPFFALKLGKKTPLKLASKGTKTTLPIPMHITSIPNPQQKGSQTYISLHSAKNQYNDRRDFRRTLGLKREVVLTDF